MKEKEGGYEKKVVLIIVRVVGPEGWAIIDDVIWLIQRRVCSGHVCVIQLR